MTRQNEQQNASASLLNHISEIYEKALRYHQSKQILKARDLYIEILTLDPNHSDSLHLLGVVSLQLGDAGLAIKLIKKAIQINPSSGIYYNNLGTALKNTGREEDAISSYKTAVSIMPELDDAYYNLGDVYKRQGQSIKAIQFFHQAIEINPDHGLAGNSLRATLKESDMNPLTFENNQQFVRFKSHTNGQVLTGVSLDRKYFLKIELIHHPLKENTLDKEAKIMQYLNAKGCMTCPQYFSSGKIKSEELRPWLNEEQMKIIETSKKESFPYLLEQYIEAGVATLPDMFLSVIEQKNLGVYNGDLKPDNLRFDPCTNICFLIDYDQAEFLDKKTSELGNLDFFEWCNQRAHEKFEFSSFLEYFPRFNYSRHVLPLFKNGAFNLGETTLYKKQQTTLASCGIYHSIHEKSIFADGERDLSRRKKLLDAIRFTKNEKILDIGCNSGLLSRYLDDRGGDVTGIDLDPSIINGARMISNILRKAIRFECWDIDLKGIPGVYDTVMLFSVLHHTRNMVVNAGLIAKACKRIIIECRLVEQGAKPEENGWTKTSEWNFPSLETMIENLERMFFEFKLKKNHGKVDRERYILEFSKKER